MKSIKEAGDLLGKRVFVRVDWNIPSVDDDFRVKKSLPTIQYLLDSGARPIIATHTEKLPIEDLKRFVPEGAELLPNLRDNPGEEANDERFAKELAGKADIYVNEAFSVSHRKHASIVSVPKLLPHFVGFEFEDEVKHLSIAFNPPHPFLLIIGGAKFETKIPLVEKFLNIADKIAIFGANAKQAYGKYSGNPKVVFPKGDIGALDFADEENQDLFKENIGGAELIVWNGPIGKYEDGHKEGTQKLAKILAESGKKTIVGGGDTLAAIRELGLYDKFTFVSTGGGAMLDYLAEGTLPGIEALG